MIASRLPRRQRCGPLDLALVDVEGPGEDDRHRKAQRQCNDGVRQRHVGQVQRVQDRLDNLQDRERDDAVAH